MPKENAPEISVDRFFRTDLACESGTPDTERDPPPGISLREYRRGELTVTRLRIENAEGKEHFKKEIGSYVTVKTGNVLYLKESTKASLVTLLASELKRMAGELTGLPITQGFHVLVAGLGNSRMTADALGPLTHRAILATRHLQGSDDPIVKELAEDYATVSAISPGVLADTGIEALELLRATAETIHPDLILAVDALAARDCERLASTVQITDTGVRPGSGVGNRRAALSRETLGVPVIAVGVPTVVDSSSLVLDALEQAGIQRHEIGTELLAVLENGTSFFVSPKEIDTLTEAFAEILGDAICMAFSVDFHRSV